MINNYSLIKSILESAVTESESTKESLEEVEDASTIAGNLWNYISEYLGNEEFMIFDNKYYDDDQYIIIDDIDDYKDLVYCSICDESGDVISSKKAKGSVFLSNVSWNIDPNEVAKFLAEYDGDIQEAGLSANDIANDLSNITNFE